MIKLYMSPEKMKSLDTEHPTKSDQVALWFESLEGHTDPFLGIYVSQYYEESMCRSIFHIWSFFFWWAGIAECLCLSTI